MIKNKTLAIILAVLTFILGSALFTGIIFYIAGLHLSSIWEGQNQLYLFTAILAAAVLASFVYGRGSMERASKVAKILDGSLGIEVKDKDIWRVLRTVEQMPPVVINKYVSMNINAAYEFKSQIEEYKDKLTDEDLLKIRKIIETPVIELQNLLNELYLETKLEQFKILAEKEARPLIELNLEELKRILF